MAGTRRRSRLSNDTTARSTPRSVEGDGTAATADDEAEVKVEGQAKGKGKGDGDGDGDGEATQLMSLPSAEQRSTRGMCRRCNAVVGEFYNAWQQITGTYFLPALAGSYSSRVRAHGRQLPATEQTDLDGCLIQPLACPNCSDRLGFHVVVAPESKHAFRGRDFFKLPRIELRCETGPNQFIVVEPIVESAPVDRVPAHVVDGSDRSSPVAVIPPAKADDMEVDTRPPSHPLHSVHPVHAPPPASSPSGLHHHHAHAHAHSNPHSNPHSNAHSNAHSHQPLQQVEANRQPPAVRSPEAPLPLHGEPQKSPSNRLPSPSPAVKPVHQVQYHAQPPSQSKEPTAGLANRTRDLPPVTSHSHASTDQPRANGQYYPRSPQDVQLDAIERLQTQISQNSGALMVHGRDLRRFEETVQGVQSQGDALRREFQAQIHHHTTEIRRVDDAVGHLQLEMHGIHELLESLSREVQAMRSMGPGMPVQAATAQDSALQLMADQVSIVSQKANEVDTLKITMEIMKNKIARLEEAAAAAAAAAQPSTSTSTSTHQYPSPHEPLQHSAHSSHTVPPYHTTPPTLPHVSTPVHPTHRPASFPSHGSHSAATPDVSQRAEPAQTPSGWVTVNASAKRAHPNGIDSPPDAIGQPLASPKRPKLAPIEPRVTYGSAQQHAAYDHMDTDDSESRAPTHVHSLPPSQTHSRDSIGEATLPSQHSVFVPYATQDAPSDDSWRPESQRIVEHRSPRGRGRGGGPGSRGGRGRKSLPVHLDLGTPEWEKEDWQGVTDSQTSPDGFYHPIARSGRGIVRRGSGGGGHASRGGRPSSSSGRAVSLGLPGVTPGVGLPVDPYAHTKKTRTKPIRNAEGILIRKDGRPDMRSQSSAANLRKVHARKEEQKGTDRSFTPASSISTGLAHTTTIDTETPSPTAYLSSNQDLTPSVQKKHNLIMGKMFPGGVDESRKEHDYARKVFDDEEGHTAHPRGQHHQHHHKDTRSGDVKREQVDERRALNSQSPRIDGDVDMDHPEDHADDEGQTPSGQSDNSGRDSQEAEATTSENVPQHNEPKANGVRPTPSTADTSQTVEAAPSATT